MSTNTPLTIWSPNNQQGEFSVSGNPNLDTESSLDLLTESGNNLVSEDSIFTPLATTVWQEDDSI